MKKIILAAAALAISTTATTTAHAQSAQERLDSRYDRALAAGYGALFVCSAMANAERNGTTRPISSIIEWEFKGIQAPLGEILATMNIAVRRGDEGNGKVEVVSVEWDDPEFTSSNQPRFAIHNDGEGCSLLPTWHKGPDGPNSQVWDEYEAAPEVSQRLQETDRSRSEIENDAVHNAFSQRYGAGARTTAVVVTRAGQVVAEDYVEGFDPATPQRTWSVAKSIAATLVGAAVHRGQAEVSRSAGLGETDEDPRRTITIDDALRMASGRYSNTAGNRTDPLYWGGTTVDERAQNWPLVYDPGTIYRYANNDTLAAVKAIAGTFETHSPADFFAKLGMDHTIAETDWQGNYVLSSQAWTTARDLAKLGQLYVNNGVWDGERLIPENWREYVSDPSGPQPVGTQWGYGAGWWTFRRPEGNAFEGIPDDAFAARGNRGQYIVVVPSRNVVIVRRGEDMVGTRFDIAAFTRDVLAALEE